MDKTPGFGPHGTCWRWTGAQASQYGAIMIERKKRLAHRVGYVLAVAPVAPGVNVRHTCSTSLCVNPAHLFVDRLQCKKGHLLTLANTYVGSDGGKRCKACIKQNYTLKGRVAQP
ncbi:hypothetical protein AXW84_18485 [Hymenobacter sp. PAMC 26628]|nr:hypothetical protein AXW84_18485 [Hymenobacter sp. PAMC 26628]